MPFYQLKAVWGLSALTSSTNKAFFSLFLFFSNCQSLVFFFIFGSFSIKLKDMAVRENPSRAAVCEINEMKWLIIKVRLIL